VSTENTTSATAATADRPEVLFVCVHNAGRSQMAAALLAHHAAGRIAVRSAGSAPADTVITMGCGDACPIFPGKRYLDWELTDPAGKGSRGRLRRHAQLVIAAIPRSADTGPADDGRTSKSKIAVGR
jgi:protein-tyrosine-phosphatase